MASSPVTFPCPFCGRRMGVTAELLGKQVRCPHCKQVVLAPASAGPAPPPPSAPAPIPAPAPRPQPVAGSPPPAPAPAPLPHSLPESERPVLNVSPRKEGADSILSEPDESEDEVFGSTPGPRVRTIPPLDAAPPAGAPAPAPLPTPAAPQPASVPDNPFAFTTSSAPAIAPLPPPAPLAPVAETAPAPAPATTNPFADLEPVSLPGAFVTPQQPPKPAPNPLPAAPQPVAMPQPFPAPAPAPVPAPGPAPFQAQVAPAPVGGNPFANFQMPAAPPAPQPVPAPAAEALPEEPPHERKKAEADEPEEKPDRGGRTRAAAKSGSGVSPIVLILVGGYAVFATIAAVYGLFIKSGPDTGHPLSTIPDNFGEFDPATRKKVTAYRFPVDGELPPEQRTPLGGKVTIGEVEVQPLRIEKRKLRVETESARGEKRTDVSRVPAFLMTLAIKNVSNDLTIYPMDPAFTRRASDTDRPITRLVVNRSTVFPGGYIEWPLDSTRIKKRIEQQQAHDTIPLKPGEEHEYIVFTDAKSDIVREVEGAKDTMQWRVQVRRGPITFRGKEVPVTAIIGVDFKASEIKSLE